MKGINRQLFFLTGLEQTRRGYIINICHSQFRRPVGYVFGHAITQAFLLFCYPNVPFPTDCLCWRVWHENRLLVVLWAPQLSCRESSHKAESIEISSSSNTACLNKARSSSQCQRVLDGAAVGITKMDFNCIRASWQERHYCIHYLHTHTHMLPQSLSHVCVYTNYPPPFPDLAHRRTDPNSSWTQP